MRLTCTVVVSFLNIMCNWYNLKVSASVSIYMYIRTCVGVVLHMACDWRDLCAMTSHSGFIGMSGLLTRYAPTIRFSDIIIMTTTQPSQICVVECKRTIIIRKE